MHPVSQLRTSGLLRDHELHGQPASAEAMKHASSSARA